MEIKIGPFHFHIGRKKKRNEEVVDDKPINKQSKTVLTLEDIDNVCSQVGALDGVKIDDSTRNVIFTEIADKLNKDNKISEKMIADIVLDSFTKNGVSLKEKTANEWAGAYIESYIITKLYYNDD